MVASCPPPIAGQSIATRMLLDQLGQRGVLHAVVDISREFHTGRKWLSIARRAADVGALPARLLLAARELRGHPIIFYLQLGQSLQSFLRDLPLLGIAYRRGWPVVLHVHGMSFRPAFDAAPPPLRRLVAAALARASRVILLAERLKSDYADLVPAERLVVIPNGVEIAVERHAASRPPRQGPVRTVLFLSNLMASKGYQDVLEVARRSAGRGEELRFLFAGGRTEWTEVDPEAFCEEHGLTNVRWLGPVFGPPKLDLLADADLFVLPSRYEGQPISILEAMHYGMPVVSTPVGGIPEMIDEGRGGHLVPVGDIDALDAAISGLAADPERALAYGRHNQALARQRYTVSAHGAQMVTLFKTVEAEMKAAHKKAAQVKGPR